MKSRYKPPPSTCIYCVFWCWELEDAEHLAWDPAQSEDSKGLEPLLPPHLPGKTEKANQRPSTVIRARRAKRLTKKGPPGSKDRTDPCWKAVDAEF